MRFEKWQALGNDYLIVERDELPFELTPARVRRLCEGHFGVFADGVLLLSPPADPQHVADLRIFNPDGSEAELSGNGAREAILYLRRRGWTDQDSFSINTPPGRSARRSPGPTPAAWTWAARASTSADFPGGSPTAAGEVIAGGRGGASSTSRSATPSALSTSPAVAGARRRSTCRRSARRSKPTSRFPNRTNVSWYTELEPAARPGGASARASSSAAWGRRCPRAPARAAPRSPMCSKSGSGRLRRDASTVAARRRRARGRGGGGSARESDRLGEARVRGSRSARLRKGAA